jgi:hypothetical protein
MNNEIFGTSSLLLWLLIKTKHIIKTWRWSGTGSVGSAVPFIYFFMSVSIQRCERLDPHNCDWEGVETTWY